MSGVGFRIEELWAFLAVHANDDEGIVGVHGQMGWVPAIAADKKRLDGLRPQIEFIAQETGQEIVLVNFSVRTDLGRVA